MRTLLSTAALLVSKGRSEALRWAEWIPARRERRAPPRRLPTFLGNARCDLRGHDGTNDSREEQALLLEGFDALFNRRDFEAAERYWSPNCIQHSAHIPPGRDGLFTLVKGLPPGMKYQNSIIMAEGDYVMAHGRYIRSDGPNWIVVDLMRIKNGIFEEHWDVIQDEATKEQSRSGLPMFGNSFPKPWNRAGTASAPGVQMLTTRSQGGDSGEEKMSHTGQRNWQEIQSYLPVEFQLGEGSLPASDRRRVRQLDDKWGASIQERL